MIGGCHHDIDEQGHIRACFLEVMEKKEGQMIAGKPVKLVDPL
jgi:hypothetical protein